MRQSWPCIYSCFQGAINIHGSFSGGLTVHTAGRSITENPGGYFGAFKPQMSSFVSAVKRGERVTRDNPGSVWEAFKDVLIAKAIYRSAQRGQWETIN